MVVGTGEKRDQSPGLGPPGLQQEEGQVLQVWGQNWSTGPDQAYLHGPNRECLLLVCKLKAVPGPDNRKRPGKGDQNVAGENKTTKTP